MSEHADEAEAQTQTQGSTSQGDNAFSAEIRGRCLKIVEDYRKGEIDKVSAILNLTSALPVNQGNDVPFREAFGAYSRMLDSIDTYRDGGRGRANAPNPLIEDITGVEEEEERGTGDAPSQEAPLVRTAKRTLRDTETHEGEETLAPKRRVNTSALPWVVKQSLDPTPLCPSLEETRSSLENFGRDIKFTVASILNSPDCPQFPHSEWTNLVSGRAVDLDHVLSGLFSISHAPKRRELVGSIEISMGNSSPAKSVTTHGEWLTAWEPTVEATTFVFPSRLGELRKYGRYITGLFAAISCEQHQRIIHLDKGVRIRAAGRRDLLLTDTHEFTDLQIHWIQSWDRNQRPRNDAQPGQPRKRDPCRRWNDSKCPNTSAKCNYLHACGKCKQPGHRSADCEIQRK